MNELSTLSHLGLLLARPGMLVAAAPVFGGQYAPVPVRLGLAVLLALFVLPTAPVPVLTTPMGLGVVLARELVIGLALALALQAVLAGAALGGHLTGYQLMLSYGSTVDPQGGVRNTLTATLYVNLALLTCLAINAHHTLIRALADSYAVLPIGTGGVDGSLVGAVVRMLGIVFVLGLRLAAPLIVVMFIAELATALMARVAPTLNLMAVAPPLRVAVGLAALAAVVGLVPGVVARLAGGVGQLGLRVAEAFR
ncbi:MAG: flagellar biosynthetic protein FliR [Vicinamibacterales bacterium]